MEKIKIHKNSIVFRILLPVIAVMLVQVFFFYGSVALSGSMSRLRENAFTMYNDQVGIRSSNLENDMVSRWGNFEDAIAKLTVETGGAILSSDDGIWSQDESLQFLRSAMDSVLYLLRKNSVTGAFLVLSGENDASDYRYGLYFRDLDPKATPTDGNYGDVSAKIAPMSFSDILADRKITLDAMSDTLFSVDEKLDEGRDCYFFQPLSAYRRYPNAAYVNLGYWGNPAGLFSDSSVITYSVPLVISGRLIGVLGVDIDQDYIKRNYMPYSELNDGSGAYVLAVESERTNVMESVCAFGVLFSRAIGEDRTILLSDKKTYENTGEVEQLRPDYRGKVWGNVQYLRLYNDNTPFSNEKWAFVGLADDAELLSFQTSFQTTMMITTIVSSVLGIGFMILIAVLMTRPITRLTADIRGFGTQTSMRLGKVNIYEIDMFIDEIENLNDNLVSAAGKLSKILSLANMDIGAFDFQNGQERIYFTSMFFKLFGVTVEIEDGYFNVEDVVRIFQTDCSFQKEEFKGEENLFRIFRGDAQGDRYVRLKISENETRKMGVATDVTDEIIEKRKIQYERDFDPLTKLFNRQAFLSSMRRLWESPRDLGICALLMMDVDNLKYVNDTYGHDVGDEYISTFGAVLRRLIPYHTLLARRSGDEFLVLFYGYDSEEEIREHIHDLKDWLKNSSMLLPNRERMRLRASGGVSWYPKDSLDMDALIKYSDFAMYKIKNSVKGEILDFDLQDYNRESFLVEGQERLNKLIDGELADMYFQPIVDVKTGSIYGYEMLMRPNAETGFTTPLEVLMLAKAQSKLSKIERLTWMKSLNTFRANASKVGADCRVFINSIPNQVLNAEDVAFMEKEYGELLSRVVVEFTEEEKRVELVTERKMNIVSGWNASVAIDDFGTGYNSETLLLEISPKYVKIDMFIVRNIDKDRNRQNIFSTLVAHAKNCGIKVIAEGVETEEELEKLVELGADYLQGYLIGKPEAEPLDSARNYFDRSKGDAE